MQNHSCTSALQDNQLSFLLHKGEQANMHLATYHPPDPF